MPEAVTEIRLGDTAPVALILLDSRRRILDTNTEAESLLVSSRRTLGDRPLSEIIYHDSPLFEVLDRAQTSPGTLTAHDMPVSGPGMGRDRVCDVHVRRLESGHFTVALSESIGRDTSDSAVGVAGFGRILGHEVKNPLAGIFGAAQLLERQGVENQSELLEVIMGESKRIERLISRLSAFELFSAPRLSSFNIHEVLDKVIAAETAAMGSDIAIHRRYDPSLPNIVADPDHLQQAFQNLMRNAGEACTSEGRQGEVTIRTEYVAGFAMKQARLGARLRRAMTVIIEDNGPGIPQAKQASIFDVFESSKSGGRGLGLAIVSEVVAAHAGHIKVESQPGRTRFSILLPIRETE